MDAPSTWSLVRDCRRAAREGASGLRARQLVRLSRRVNDAKVRSPYFARLYRGVPDEISDVRQLPPVSRAELMEHFDDWLCDRSFGRNDLTAFVSDLGRIGDWFRGRYLVFTSSGAVGVPGIFLHDAQAWDVYNALGYARGLGAYDLRRFSRVIAQGGRRAVVMATGGHYAHYAALERRRRDRPWRRGFTRVFSALEPVDHLVAALNEFEPVLLSGYPSALLVLAKEREAGRLELDLELVSAFGETLGHGVEARLEKAFGCRVTNAYACSEGLALTHQCHEGSCHLNADWFMLEPIDRRGQPVPPGDRSASVLFTNLANAVQPILRYDLGDSVTMVADPCPCGSVLPAIRVDGRTADLLTFTSVDRAEVDVVPLAIASVAEETPGVRRCQLVQVGPETLRVRYETDPDHPRGQVWHALSARLAGWLASQHLPNVKLERGDEPPRLDGVGGKLRRTVRELRGAPPPDLEPTFVPPEVAMPRVSEAPR